MARKKTLSSSCASFSSSAVSVELCVEIPVISISEL